METPSRSTGGTSNWQPGVVTSTGYYEAGCRCRYCVTEEKAIRNLIAYEARGVGDEGRIT